MRVPAYVSFTPIFSFDPLKVKLLRMLCSRPLLYPPVMGSKLSDDTVGSWVPFTVNDNVPLPP